MDSGVHDLTEFVRRPPPTLWDARDVAAYLKVSRSWVYQRSESGDIPSLRIGGLVRFDPDTIQTWARGGQRRP
jgi:excisionase family DNA binding protein